MTVQELIEQLQKVEDKSQTVVIGVYTATKVYPVAYPEYKGSHNQAYGEYRLFVHLPDGMSVSQRKVK